MAHVNKFLRLLSSVSIRDSTFYRQWLAFILVFPQFFQVGRIVEIL